MGSPLYRLGVGTATLTSPITMGGGPLRRRSDVRFGSLADMCSAKGHVRFTPNSDVDCVFRRVCFGPQAGSALALFHGCPGTMGRTGPRRRKFRLLQRDEQNLAPH